MTTLQADIQKEINKLYNDSELIELFVLDATAFGGPLFRFTNNPGPTGGGVVFDGNTYVPIPIMGTGFDVTTTGTLPTPSITISNVNKVIQSAVISFGDLIGAKLTRIRTYGKFLDAATFPRRNLVNYSQDYDNAYWTKTNVTPSLVTSPVSPRSKKEAFRLLETTTNGVHTVAGSVAVTSGLTYTFSAYVRSLNGRNVMLEVGQAAEFGAIRSATFDLTAVSVLSTTPSTSAVITDMGNDWYRVQVTAACTTSGTCEPRLYIASGTSTSYAGNTSNGLYVFGMQYEAASLMTDYQFTTSNHQPFANPSAFMSEKWKVEQMTEMTNTSIQFMLATELDRLRFKFGRQVLKDASVKNVYAPGIARSRTR